jgi:hypothetical protein
MNTRLTLSIALLLALCLPAPRSLARSRSTMKADLAARSKEIKWPPDISPEKADYFAHNQLAIDAKMLSGPG